MSNYLIACYWSVFDFTDFQHVYITFSGMKPLYLRDLKSVMIFSLFFYTKLLRKEKVKLFFTIIFK